MKNYILILSSFCINSVLFGQSVTDLLNQAEANYEKEKYSESALLYEEAFKSLKASGQRISAGNYYAVACSWVAAGENRKAMDYMLLSAERGFSNLEWIQSDPKMEPLREMQDWSRFINRVKLTKQEIEASMNLPLKDTLEVLYMRDQALRRLYVDAMEKFKNDEESFNYFMNVMAQEDRKNEEILISLIDQYGWPHRSIVGGKANAAAFMVFQHAPLEIQQKYFPMLKESALNGESTVRHYAMMEDRIRVRTDRPQLFGTQFKYDKELEKNVFYKIEDPETVNERRLKVGFDTIEEMAEKRNIDLDSYK